ncbi:RNA exonuclease 3, partial [Terramyces sp. JEL0728]
MFPTLNFKHIKCPLLRNCRNGPFCLFSHSVISNKRPALPIQSQPKRQVTKAVKNEIQRETKVTKSAIETPLAQPQIPVKTKAQIDPSSRPIIATDINGKVAKDKRQKVLDKIYSEFLRIYANLPISYAHQHAVEQEAFIYKTSTVQSYISKATSIFSRLKKRPIAKHEGDIGLDGEWKETVIETIPLKELKDLVMSNAEQLAHEYPNPTLLNLVNLVEDEPKNQKKKCDRCGTTYIPISNPPQTECNYHWGRLVSRSGERAFSCCQATIGTVGCSQGPHVYKDAQDTELHYKIPFDSAPDGKGKEVVALDCEMGYTLGGFELVRVSIVDWYGNIILDEIVQPLNAIICYNTRFSGIKVIPPGSKTLAQVKQSVYEIIKKDTIIIGHALENDLRQLRVTLPIQSQPKRQVTKAVKNEIQIETKVTKSAIEKPLAQPQIPVKTKAQIDPSSRPIIATDINGKVAKDKRQKVLDKIYSEFLRIYANLPISYAHQHAVEQEAFIYKTSTVQSYISKATSIFSRLKKRPIAKHEGDIGLDGEWKETVIETIPLKELKDLVMSNAEQLAHEYPNPNLLKLVNLVEDEPKNQKKKCDRCGTTYIPISNPPQTECNYHWGRLVSRSGERAFSCCQATIGTVGCSQGPHVYKDAQDTELHYKIPFDSAPDGKGKEVVALDCEMGYTLGGFELVRVSIVDWYGNIILDEIVQPLNAIICYNTRFSGIKVIPPGSKTLAQVKQLVYEIIKKDTIIIGHALENDLRQLR